METGKSIFVSILQSRCPRCRKGHLFISPNPYKLKYMTKMPEQCSVCKLDFVQELGFYWGAMYVSYGLTVAFSFFNFMFTYLIWGWLTWQFIIGNTLVLILTLPVMFRYSRVIWLYLFGRYRTVSPLQ
jgi:uncharacterized protein (DUF983 family)